ncbi:MAG: DUF5663 domain-containing protein [Candidatus Saccharibacteria bacterium]|nr:DUF5663 domain-containing protein [Candidatus Saccharibacteria bacterium]
MYKFDDSFLESVGLEAMPAEQKDVFLQYAQDQLEVRIGEKMSEGLSDEQLDEFEKIIDNDQATLDAWIAGAGDYKSDAIYQKLSESLDDEGAVLSNYVTAKWLNQNCPQYQQIIQDSIESLRGEIAANKDALLANM